MHSFGFELFDKTASCSKLSGRKAICYASQTAKEKFGVIYVYRERAHMKNEEHLPIYGVGPLYVFVITVLTLAAVLMRNMPFFSSGKLSVLRIPLLIAGVVSVAAGIALWIYAVPISKIDVGIKENRLVTTGAYALVRNPIYSAAMLVCTGVILLVGNACFFLLPLFSWLFMTVLMKATEEKWLEDLYGAEYRDYCRRVNRCWPWFKNWIIFFRKSRKERQSNDSGADPSEEGRLQGGDGQNHAQGAK